MTDLFSIHWYKLSDAQAEELLARASGGEAIFCEALAMLAAA